MPTEGTAQPTEAKKMDNIRWKDDKQSYFKNYYQNNKDKILINQGQKIKCKICEKLYRKDWMIYHIKKIHN